MIPVTSRLSAEQKDAQAFQIPPTKTYRIDTVNNRIIGMIEGPEAILQYIRKVMSTDKYAFEVYNWYYGNELIKLVGKPYDYVVARIPNIFKEALMVDSRITDIRDFTFSRPSMNSVKVACVVDTIYGKIKYEQEVMI